MHSIATLRNSDVEKANTRSLRVITEYLKGDRFGSEFVEKRTAE